MIHLKEFATQAEYEAFVASGEMKKPNVSFVEETMEVHYAQALKKGVFIQHIDGTLYTTEEWQALGLSGDEANGVAVSTDEAAFVVAKSYANEEAQTIWGANISLEGIVTTSSIDEAKTDFRGLENTNLLASKDTTGAAFLCSNYIFPNGQRGYLPALGEWFALFENVALVRSAMTTIGGTDFKQYNWSSTIVSTLQAWMCAYSDWMTPPYSGSKKDKNSAYNMFARPFLPL